MRWWLAFASVTGSITRGAHAHIEWWSDPELGGSSQTGGILAVTDLFVSFRFDLLLYPSVSLSQILCCRLLFWIGSWYCETQEFERGDDGFNALYARYASVHYARVLFEQTTHKVVYLWNTLLGSFCYEGGWIFE